MIIGLGLLGQRHKKTSRNSQEVPQNLMLTKGIPLNRSNKNNNNSLFAQDVNTRSIMRELQLKLGTVCFDKSLEQFIHFEECAASYFFEA